MRASTLWRILAAVFFTVGIVAALGEWVFHWWRDPGQWVAAAGILLGLLSLAVSASSREVETLRREQGERFDQLLGALGSGQAEQTRTLASIRDAQAEQNRTLASIRDAQAEQNRTLASIRDAQAEQTRLLREVVASFQGRAGA